jgi:hypothetical protein
LPTARDQDRVVVTPQAMVVTPSLSARLRAQTAPLHRQIENYGDTH